MSLGVRFPTNWSVALRVSGWAGQGPLESHKEIEDAGGFEAAVAPAPYISLR
jgi:hypothetical protein